MAARTEVRNLAGRRAELRKPDLYVGGVSKARAALVAGALALAGCASAVYPAGAILDDLDRNPARVHSLYAGRRISVRGYVRDLGMTERSSRKETTTRLVFGALVSDTVEVKGPQMAFVVVDAGEADDPVIICLAKSPKQIGELERYDKVQVNGVIYEVTERAALMRRCTIEYAGRPVARP